MSRTYAKALTKKMLEENFGITNVTTDGLHVYTENGEVHQVKIKSGKREYWAVLLRDKTDNVKFPCRSKYVAADGTVRYYESSAVRPTTLAVHRLVYIWYKGDQDEGMVIDHIDNNPLNNNLDNLQMITPTENVNKDKRKPKKLKASFRGIEYIERQLEHYTKLCEEAKARGDQEAAHRYRTSISNYKAQQRDYYEHQAEYEAASSTVELHRTWDEEYHLRAVQLQALQTDVDYWHAMYLQYKNDPTMGPSAKAAWRESVVKYENFKNDK